MAGDWRTRVARVTETMREVSLHTDPQAMIEAYGRSLEGLEFISVSRRGLERPCWRVTRDGRKRPTRGKKASAPAVVQGGLVGEIVYSNEAHVLTDFELERGDPSHPFVSGYRTLIAVPHFDMGEALNWVIHLRREAEFDGEHVPDLVWQSSLFGRMTYNLVLAGRLREANAALDEELADVARVQRALLPAAIPACGRVRLAAESRPARRAGGDYYGVRALRDGRLGLVVADVSGHTAQATVLMAMVHALAHLSPSEDPGGVLGFVNRAMCDAGPRDLGRFVTAFCGVIDPSGAVSYASAGHPPARLVRADGAIEALGEANGMALGIEPAERYSEASAALKPGDSLVCYTDGVTDAPNSRGVRFGVGRLDAAVRAARRSAPDAGAMLERIMGAVGEFAGKGAGEDDLTLLVACAA